MSRGDARALRLTECMKWTEAIGNDFSTARGVVLRVQRQEFELYPHEQGRKLQKETFEPMPDEFLDTVLHEFQDLLLLMRKPHRCIGQNPCLTQ